MGLPRLLETRHMFRSPYGGPAGNRFNIAPFWQQHMQNAHGASLFREAQLEKKAARREAAREREQSPDMSKLPGGGDIMGGDDSFAAARAR